MESMQGVPVILMESGGMVPVLSVICLVVSPTQPLSAMTLKFTSNVPVVVYNFFATGEVWVDPSWNVHR